MTAEGHRPMCQDTGHRASPSSRWAWMSAGRRSCRSRSWSTRACAARTPTRTTRCAARCSPTRTASARTRGDNTPGVTHVELVPGDKVEVIVAAKGGGSENKSKFAMLLPNDSIVDWVLSVVPTMGADWCPPGMLSLGIGGSPEKAMLMAKWAMMEPMNMHELKARGPKNRAEELRLELFEKVNALGIGAQGLGGLTTVLDVKVIDYPTHAASKPVALLPNCAATRHVALRARRQRPGDARAAVARRLAEARRSTLSTSRRVNLDTLTKAEIAHVEVGRAPAALRQAPHRPRCRPQAPRRDDGEGREAARRLHQSLHLLRRPGRPGARRGRRPGGSDHELAHGQVRRARCSRRPG